MSTFPARNRWVDVVVAQREATDRLLAEELSPSVLKVGIYVITRLSSYSRFAEPMTVPQAVSALGFARETVNRALRKLSSLGVIAWRGSRGHGQRSWVALAAHYLPMRADLLDPDVTASVPSDVTTAVSPVREVLHEESSRRESAPTQADDEELTEREAHEVDCSFAASSIVEHLFPAEKDQRVLGVVKHRAFRAFQRSAPGRVSQVLNLALQGTPARHIDSPAPYVERWISNARDDLQLLDLLEPTPQGSHVLTTQSAQC